MSFTESFDAYLADFGVTATVGQQDVTVIVDGPASDALGVIANRYGAQLTTADAELQSIEEGTALTISGTAYTVTARRDDGTGWTQIELAA